MCEEGGGGGDEEAAIAGGSARPHGAGSRPARPLLKRPLWLDPRRQIELGPFLRRRDICGAKTKELFESLNGGGGGGAARQDRRQSRFGKRQAGRPAGRLPSRRSASLKTAKRQDECGTVAQKMMTGRDMAGTRRACSWGPARARTRAHEELTGESLGSQRGAAESLRDQWRGRRAPDGSESR